MAERLVREALESRVRDVFGDSPLLPVTGWTDELSGELSSVQLPRLASTRSLSVVKSFLTSSYFSRIRPAIAAAAVELDFNDRNERTALSEAADEASRLHEEIAAFESWASEHGRSEFSRVVSSLPDAPSDNAGRLRARRAVEEANGIADRLIQDAFSRFGALRDRLASIRDDLRSRRGEIVANAGLVNVHKSDIARGVEEGARLFDITLDLLKRLAVDAADAQKTLSSAGERSK
jgi:hypothetical protein